MNDIIQTIAVYALPVIFAITLHEAARGYVARLFGDPTAYQAGRISLNPARHIDPVGTLLVPVAILLASKLLAARACFSAGPSPCRSISAPAPKQDMLWVALAGPAAMLMAVLRAGAAAVPGSGMQESFWFEMGVAGVNVNLVLMALNLLPLPPLDGDGSFSACSRLAWQYSKIEPYGLMIVVVLLATGVLWTLMRPIIGLGTSIVQWFLL